MKDIKTPKTTSSLKTLDEHHKVIEDGAEAETGHLLARIRDHKKIKVETEQTGVQPSCYLGDCFKTYASAY